MGANRLKNRFTLATSLPLLAVPARLAVVRCNGRIFIIIGGPTITADHPSFLAG
jgi:hypothetical protein